MKTYFHESEASAMLQGNRNPSRVADPRKMLDQYDIILSDQEGVGLICDDLAAQKPVIGGGTFCDKIADDFLYKQRVLHASCKQELTSPHPSKGLELWLEGWFTSSGWAPSYILSLKHTRLMPGEIGPQMPCMGGVVYSLRECKLTLELLFPFTELLKKLNYLGPFSVHFSIEDNVVVHNLHAGFSFDSFQAMCELLPCSVFDFLYSLVAESGSKQLLSSTALAVRLLVQNSEAPVLIQLDEGAKKHTWVTDQEAKHTNHVCTVTARGQSVRECQRRAYRTIKNITSSADVMYRNDIGLGAEELFASLKRDGWLGDISSKEELMSFSDEVMMEAQSA